MSDLKGIEALRGLTAIGIATYSWIWSIGMAGSPPAANLHLLYDLFFVISGFVIAQIYRARLTSGREVARFALLRFGRVYPLHVAVLLVLLAITWFASPGGLMADDGALRSFLANLAMVQGFGVVETGGWNAPAWFISVEFALSILFALLCLGDIPRSGIGLGAILLSVLWALWLLAGRGEGAAGFSDSQLLRGFAGFMLGVLAQALRQSGWWRRRIAEQGAILGTAHELAAAAITMALLVFAPPAAHAASPIVFAMLVLALSGARGGVSSLLMLAPLQALARISFGVFMCHWLLATPAGGFAARPSVELPGGLVVPPHELAALATPLYLLAVIALAIIAERWVERPTREAMRAWIDRRSRGLAAARRRSDIA